MLSFFRSTKKEASLLPQPAYVPAQQTTAKPSSLKITLASQHLRHGAVLSIEPRYWSFLSSSSRPAPIPPISPASSKLALIFGNGRQEEEDEDEEEERTILKHASQENAPVYLRFVLVGDHRALIKARSKAILRLDRDGASCVWPGKEVVQLVVPETATRFRSGDLSLVMEAFEQGAEGGKDVLLARGIVHHFMEHLQKAEAPRVLVLPLVSTCPAIGSSRSNSSSNSSSSSSSGTSKGIKNPDNQETRSEACIRLTYLPLVPPRHCRFAVVEGEVIDKKLDEAKHVNVHEQFNEEEADVKMEKKADARKTRPESGNEESAGVQQQQQQQQQHAPKTQAMQKERVSSVGSNLHLDLAASLVEQIRQEQESTASPLRMPGEEVVPTSEQEEEDKVVEVCEQEGAKAQVLQVDVLMPSLQAEVVGHGGRTAARAGAAAAAAAALGLSNKPAGKPLPAPLGEGRRQHKSTASASRRRAQLARVNRLLTDLETLPTTLKGGLEGGSKGTWSR